MHALQGVDTIGENTHKDNFYHTLKVLENVCLVSDDLWLRWAAILHDIAKPPTKKYHHKHGWTFHGHENLGAEMVPGIFKRMRLPLDQPMKYVQKLVRLHLRPIGLAKEDITDSAIRRLIFEAGDDIEDLLKLCRADITSKNKVKVKKYIENFDLVEQKTIEIENKDHLRNFQPPVDGALIMKTFGIGPSKYIGIIKTAIKEAILEGEIQNNLEEATALMMKIGLQNGLTKVAEN
jgi:putative nucleotidyltransferase with HDIG domain